jgi:hypothetical protein
VSIRQRLEGTLDATIRVPTDGQTAAANQIASHVRRRPEALTREDVDLATDGLQTNHGALGGAFIIRLSHDIDGAERRETLDVPPSP